MIDLSKILSKYKKDWLALSPNNKVLLAAGNTLVEVLKKAKKKGVDNPSVLKSGPLENFLLACHSKQLFLEQ